MNTENKVNIMSSKPALSKVRTEPHTVFDLNVEKKLEVRSLLLFSLSHKVTILRDKS